MLLLPDIVYYFTRVHWPWIQDPLRHGWKETVESECSPLALAAIVHTRTNVLVVCRSSHAQGLEIS
jgi:hypothetical protein